MAGLRIDISRGLRELERGLNDFQRRQLPFAVSQALNAVAADAAKGEQRQIGQTFGPVTAFTRRAIGIRRANKSTLTATIFVKDIQARYLAPYLPGGSGRQVLNANAVLQPIDLATNQYGNIPRGKLATLKGRADVFVGAVTMKDGQVINGVWRRLKASEIGRGRRGRKGAPPVAPIAGKRLELLIRFADPKDVKERLAYGQPTAGVVQRRMGIELERALINAMATAR